MRLPKPTHTTRSATADSTPHAGAFTTPHHNTRQSERDGASSTKARGRAHREERAKQKVFVHAPAAKAAHSN